MREVNQSLIRVVVASAVMGVVVWLGAGLGDWTLGGNDPRNLAVFAGTALVGLMTYLLVAAMLRTPELVDVVSAVRRRIRA